MGLRSTARVTVIVALALTASVEGLWLTRPAAAQLSANATSLTVTTTNSVATFSGPDLTGLVNSLTGESYLIHPSSGQLAGVNTIASTGQTLQASNWTIGSEAGTGHPIATITCQDATRTLILRVKVDPVSQEVVLRLSASTTVAGLRDASWSIAGLNLDTGRLILPSDTGIVLDRAHPNLGPWTPLYPNNWHAQMAVYETTHGSFVFYSTDTQANFKQLRTSTRGSSSIDVTVATEAVAPWPSATAVPTIEWRLKSFSGDWRAAAAVYRDWLLANRPPLSNAAHPWVSDITTVVTLPSDTALLAPLAAVLIPSQTLLYLVDWRVDPFDVDYPDYTPRAGMASFISAAHTLGFKVMLHLDAIGVSPGNPSYPAMQPYQARSSETLALLGWQWDLSPSLPGRFAFINPAAPAFRNLMIASIAAGISGLNADALHLDISSSAINDGNGLIGGLNYAQGMAQLHQDIASAFPTLAIGGEGETDVTTDITRLRSHGGCPADRPKGIRSRAFCSVHRYCFTGTWVSPSLGTRHSATGCCNCSAGRSLLRSGSGDSAIWIPRIPTTRGCSVCFKAGRRTRSSLRGQQTGVARSFATRASGGRRRPSPIRQR